MNDPARPANAPLRWKRALVFAAVVAAILLAIAWAPLVLQNYENHRERKAAEPRPIVATDAQQAAIVRGLLGGHRYRGVPPPPPEPGDPSEGDEAVRFPLLLDRTTQIPFCAAKASDVAPPLDCPIPPPGQPSGNWLYSDDPFLREIPQKLRQELVMANAQPTAQPDPVLPGVRVVDRNTAFAPLASTDWSAFYAKYPEATGILETSRAVLSADGNEALVFAWNRCDSLCGEGGLFHLERRGEGWRIRKVLIFMSS